MLTGTDAFVCVDASVGAKWFLRDEEDAQPALVLLERFALGKLGILVPDLFFYEMGSLLSVAVRRKGISEIVALAVLDELERLALDRVGLRGDMDSALAFAQWFNVSFYDAAYLAAAESRGVPLVTCDKRLLDAVGTKLDWVLSPAAVSRRPPVKNEIRELTESEAAVFLDVVGEAEMGGHYNSADAAHRRWVTDTIHRYFARGARFFAVLGPGQQPLAYAAVLVDDAPGFRCKAELISFGTGAGHRRKGIGSELIDHITGVCRELNLYCIVTSTYAGDAPAVSFYCKNGFAPAALLPGVHGPRDEGQLYLRKLVGTWDWTPS